MSSCDAAVTQLSSQLSTGTNSRLEELGSQVAQVRERLADMDQALTATANALRSQQAAVVTDNSAAVPAIVSDGQLINYIIAYTAVGL